MKNVLVFVLLISILLVIGILYYDSYNCSKNVFETYTSNKALQSIHNDSNFEVTDGAKIRLKKLLVDNEWIDPEKIINETGYLKQGSYYDKGWYDSRARKQTLRAIPIYARSINSKAQCEDIAKKNNFGVYGLQVGSQCFVGTDLNRATMYGKDPRYVTENSLGLPWNNQVYANKKAIDEAISDVELYDYTNVSKWLTSDDVGIRNLPDLDNMVQFLEGYTDGPNTAMSGEPPITSITDANVDGILFEKIKAKLDSKIPNFEFSPNNEKYPTLVTSSFAEFRKLNTDDLQELSKLFNTNEIRNTYTMREFTDKISNIGYTADSLNNLSDILTLLNSYGRKSFEIDDDFINRYKKFGLNSTSNLHKFISQLMAINVRDPVNIAKDDLNRIVPFVTFAEDLQSIGVTYSNFDDFCNTMNILYSPIPSINNWDYFLKNIKQYLGKSTIMLDDIKNFKADLAIYNIKKYSEYLSIKELLTIFKVNTPFQQLFAQFVNYYNTDYIQKLSYPGNRKIPTVVNSNDDTISLYHGLRNFIQKLYNEGYTSTPKLDLTTLITEYSNTNVSRNDIIAKNAIVQPKQAFTVISEGFTERLETPQNELKYQMYGYYAALIAMGFTDVNNMKIILPENDSGGEQSQTYNQLNTRLSQYLGAQDDNDRVKILSYMVSLQAHGKSVYKFCFLLNGVGINMSNFVNITNSLYTLGFTNFEHISNFLEKLKLLNVKIEGLQKFSNTLAEFGVNYKRSADLFFGFLSTLTHYNITNRHSQYDTKNTNFYNFMYNMKLDNITYDQYKIFELAMFTSFTGGNTLRNSIPLEHEKPILDIQLREIIIRKDSLLFGVDNTINGKHSNEPINGALQLDPELNIVSKYQNITNNAGTIMPLVPVKTEDGGEFTPGEIYNEIFKDKGTDKKYINDNLRLVSQILTPYEYQMMKTEPGHLHARSVMSRLCSLLKENIDTNKNTDRYQPTITMNLLLNSVRTFPYTTFGILCASLKTSGNMYRLENSRKREGNVYTLSPPIKEPALLEADEEGFATLTSGKEYYGNYQSMFSSNRTFPFMKISDTKLYDSYDLSKTSFMNHSNVM